MPLLRRLTALALLALWLPATAHCSFEAAGFEELFACATGHEEAPGTDAHQDGCDTVENGGFRSTSGTIALPAPALAPDLLALLVIAPQPPLLPPENGLGTEPTAPPELARTWHFIARAAPSPRAPAFVS